MRKKKKGTSGEAVAYMTRKQAIKKLGLTLADFRRLCILKGIYPREPKNKKKVLKGSSSPKTLYWVKDILFLAHEPLLRKFRDFKAFTRKLRRALGKKEYSIAAHLKQNKPVYQLDHLIRERYPTFIDAVRDLDDALCMVFLFSRMAKSRKIYQRLIESCTKLTAEFQHYCIATNAIRKVFLSIKGIYYQAEIKGQTVTWIVPYSYTQTIPGDVDLRVMTTFLEFYETLLGFVNYKLYTDENYHYPPLIQFEKDQAGYGLSSFVLEKKDATDNVSLITQSIQNGTGNSTSISTKNEQAKQSQLRIASLKTKLDTLEQNITEDESKEETEKENNQLDEFPENKAENENSVDFGYLKMKDQDKQIKGFQKLFSGCVFFLSREIPRDSVEFLIRCFGGKLGWESGEGSPFKEEDESITHHIVDRPSQRHTFLSRDYIQPQWIFDCINFQTLLPVRKYTPGTKLPPHFSPFVVEQEGDYIPPELVELRKIADGISGPVEALTENGENEQEGEEEDSDNEVLQEDEEEGDEEEENEEDEINRNLDEEDQEDQEEEQEEALDSDDDEAIYQRELEAEAKGVSYSQYKPKTLNPKLKEQKVLKKQKQEEQETKDLAKIMMKKKHKRLLTKIERGQKKKERYVQNMVKKRQRVEQAEKEEAKKARVK